MTRESYRHFVEHAYNQFFQHESFHSSACSKTTTKDMYTAGVMDTSTKLQAYTWVTNDGRVARVPMEAATTYQMPDPPQQPESPMPMIVSDDEKEEIVVDDAPQLPLLQVVVQPTAGEILGIPPQEDDDAEMEEVKVEEEQGGSQEREEPMVDTGDFSQEERPALPYAASPEARYGNYIVSQLSRSQERVLRHWTLAMGRFRDQDDEQNVPQTPEEITSFQLAMMVDFVADAEHQEFVMTFPMLTGLNISHEEFHELHVVCKNLKKKNEHIKVATFETEDDPQLPVNPHGKDMEFMIPEDKHLILEGDNSKLVDCTVTWLNMLNKDLQERVLSRIQDQNKLQIKQEEEDEDAEEEQEARKEPVIPQPTRVSIEVQTDPVEEAGHHGSSSQGEAPSSSTGSTKVEVAVEEKSKGDDTAPDKEVDPSIVSTSEITGNEDTSVLRNLKDCFSDGYYGEWAGFYNKGFPASQAHRHMLWHLKYRTTTENHDNMWYKIEEEDLMREYINRHKDEDVNVLLTEISDSITYSCSDPRMHERSQTACNKLTAVAFDRHQKEFSDLEDTISNYIDDHGCIPYATILHLLAIRYLGAGLPSPDDFDKDYPYRSSKALSVMFWNLGNWRRLSFNKEPLPPNLEKFRPHVRTDIDTEHRVLKDRPAYNNFFVSAVKNLKAHLFLNCEAQTIFQFQDRLKEAGWSLCFNDWTDLMCAARLGKDGYIKQIAGYKTKADDTKPRYVSWGIFEIKWGQTVDRNTDEIEELKRAKMTMTRVCIYHVGQNNIGKSPAMCGEVIAHMIWECLNFEVDIIAGDGNKAAYLTTPKKPGIPTYEVSLLQFWIDRLVRTATQARKKIDADSVPVRAKHFISASYMDLTYLHQYLSKVKSVDYDQKLIDKTTDKGDCCMMTLLEWGHSRYSIVENLQDFDDEDHMEYHGEFNFTVNETCLSCDHEAFLVHERDRDAHNPLLIHFDPHTTRKEARTFRSGESKLKNKQRRKELQKANRRKGYHEQDDDDDDEEETWINPTYTQEDWWTWQQHERQRQRSKGRGRGHFSTGRSSSSWQPKQQWR